MGVLNIFQDIDIVVKGHRLKEADMFTVHPGEALSKIIFDKGFTVRIDAYSPEKLRELMKEKELNQKQLAQLSSLSQGSISGYLAGDVSPTDAALKKLGKALDVLFYSDWIGISKKQESSAEEAEA